ncbi:LON domain serine protease [Ceratobasidium sp. AG-Ba]|nr:LON domain serine protease [Ceratobasidium sp. AG-Ba]
MHSSPNEVPELAPSQFAYFKTVQPTTTASGVVPGRAPLDTPPPGRTPSPPLERSQRSRKPSTRKLEGAASQGRPGTSKSQGKQRAQPSTSKLHNKKAGNASNAGTSRSATITESQHGGPAVASRSGATVDGPETQYEAQGDEDPSEYEYETLPIDPIIVQQIESLFGGDIEELSPRQIQNLADKIAQTETLAMGTQVEPTTTIAQSAVGVGLAGGDRDVSPSHEDSGERLFSQNPNASANSKVAMSTQKRRLEAPVISGVSKRARIATDKGDSATESESESEPDSKSKSDSESDSDADRSSSSSDSDRDPLPLSKPKGFTSTATRPQLTLAGRGLTPAVRPPTLVPNRPPAKTTTSTIAASTAATTSAASYLVRHSPPADLTNNEALINWALEIAADRVLRLNPNASVPGPDPPTLQQLDPPNTTTTSHVAQAIANHRIGRAASQHLGTQPNTGSSSQATTSTAAAARGSTPSPATDAATPSVKKKKHRKKTKLSDFPGRPGEVASAAIPYFLATVFAEGGYEHLDTLQDWALDAYRRSYNLEYPDEAFEPPPVAILKIMTRRASWLRGEIKKRIRAGVEYGYGFRNPAVTRADIKHNKRLAKKLKPQVFHCKNLVFDTDQFEHPEFIRAIGAGLFWDPDSLGVVFKDRFKPVPIPAAALVLTMMQACIAEWKEGRHKAIELDITTQKTVYETHLLSLYSYENIAASRLTRFRTQWATAGLDYSGATFDEDPTAAKSYVSNVRPDTPPPPSDNE